jgi:ABC-2 type transport system permease protein
MTGYRDVVVKELQEAWRTRRLHVLAILFAAVGVAAPLITKVTPDLIQLFGSTPFITDLPTPGVADVVGELLTLTIQFGAVAAILLAMGRIATERSRGTAAFVLVRPVTRGAFLWAKLVALGIELAIGIGLAVAVAYAYTSLLFHRPSGLGWIELGGVIWLSAMVYGSITLLGSTLSRSAAAAGALGLVALVVVSTLSVIPNFVPWLPSGLTSVGLSFALREQSPDVDPVTTILVSIGIGAVAIVLAWLRFRRVDL